MQARSQTKMQAVVTVLSFVILAGIAAAPMSSAAPAGEVQSFIGTAPAATTIEPLPPQF
jgi:hypothetical protein